MLRTALILSEMLLAAWVGLPRSVRAQNAEDPRPQIDSTEENPWWRVQHRHRLEFPSDSKQSKTNKTGACIPVALVPNELSCFDPSKQEWRWHIVVDGKPVIWWITGTIILLTSEAWDRLLAVDREHGDVLWVFNRPLSDSSAPTWDIKNKYVAVVLANGLPVILDSLTGTPVSVLTADKYVGLSDNIRTLLGGDSVDSPIIFWMDRVVFLTRLGNQIRSVDISSGKEIANGRVDLPRQVRNRRKHIQALNNGPDVLVVVYWYESVRGGINAADIEITKTNTSLGITRRQIVEQGRLAIANRGVFSWRIPYEPDTFVVPLRPGEQGNQFNLYRLQRPLSVGASLTVLDHVDPLGENPPVVVRSSEALFLLANHRVLRIQEGRREAGKEGRVTTSGPPSRWLAGDQIHLPWLIDRQPGSTGADAYRFRKINFNSHRRNFEFESTLPVYHRPNLHACRIASRRRALVCVADTGSSDKEANFVVASLEAQHTNEPSWTKRSPKTIDPDARDGLDLVELDGGGGGGGQFIVVAGRDVHWFKFAPKANDPPILDNKFHQSLKNASKVDVTAARGRPEAIGAVNQQIQLLKRLEPDAEKRRQPELLHMKHIVRDVIVDDKNLVSATDGHHVCWNVAVKNAASTLDNDQQKDCKRLGGVSHQISSLERLSTGPWFPFRSTPKWTLDALGRVSVDGKSHLPKPNDYCEIKKLLVRSDTISAFLCKNQEIFVIWRTFDETVVRLIVPAGERHEPPSAVQVHEDGMVGMVAVATNDLLTVWELEPPQERRLAWNFRFPAPVVNGGLHWGSPKKTSRPKKVPKRNRRRKKRGGKKQDDSLDDDLLVITKDSRLWSLRTRLEISPGGRKVRQ